MYRRISYSQAWGEVLRFHNLNRNTSPITKTIQLQTKNTFNTITEVQKMRLISI